jgi:hypothetical protein
MGRTLLSILISRLLAYRFPTMSFGRSFLILFLLLAAGRSVDAAKRIDFNRDVRPVLSDKCFFCHGPDRKHRKAGLRLDDEAAAKKEVIVPGQPDAGEFIKRILTADPDERMPPPESEKHLSAAEKELFRKWIEQGAEYDEYWAYVPPVKHPVPNLDDSKWPRNWIDNFIFARLGDERLTPAPDADRTTLIRRVSFDLTGLPPTADEAGAFVNSTDPKAYEKLVDRLLGSRHFGERLAMYWLDLVRYADTVGYHGDQTHAISPYRDYVIESFNRNKPFDQFTREQLAGDLLESPTLEQRIATGYNRLLQTSHEGGVQEKEYLAIYAADRIRNFSAVWMGATVGCAQCHDHKYDPYTAKDFYSLVAVFADVDENAHLNPGRRRGLNFNALPSPRPPEIFTGSEKDQQRRRKVEQEISALVAKLKKEKDKTLRARLDGQVKALQQELVELKRRVRKTMVTVSMEPRTIRILPRGNWLDDTGPIVQPAVPEFMGRAKGDGSRTSRLDLANWLLDPQKGIAGLTARVMANRFWYLLFGTGIAADLDDFGGQGEPPVHPELLDNLAVDFRDHGWDIKRAIKQMVMSRTYRLSSLVSETHQATDPLNRFHARQARYRLDAEMVRDTALAVSGLLVREYGGRPAKPYQPAGYYRHLNFPTRTYRADENDQQWRRGVYVHWQRQYLHPMLKAMDAPSREECTAERPRSNTPTAALTLLNDPTFVEAARAFATRILTEGGASNYARINYAFREALSRPPDSWERGRITELLIAGRADYRKNPGGARDLIETGLSDPSKDVDSVQLAAWTTVARAILNLNETIARN